MTKKWEIENIEDLMEHLSGEKTKIPEHCIDFIHSQEEKVIGLSAGISSKKREIQELKTKLEDTYQPNGRGSFLEVGRFEEYNSLHFFYALGQFIDKAFTPHVGRLEMLNRMVNKTVRGKYGITKPTDYKQKLIDLRRASEDTVKILSEGMLPFEDLVKHAYKRAIDQYRYLQKRFLNVGIDDSRAYRNPWDDNGKMGYDLNRVPYVKIELIDDNPMLTDLLLDTADNLPRLYTRKEKVKGKKKAKEVKYLDEFELMRATRVLIEISDPSFHEYIKEPRKFLSKISDSIMTYYETLSSLEHRMREVLEGERDNPIGTFEVGGRDFERHMANPSSIVHRLNGINYNSVRPREEETRPNGQLEREYFAGRRKLLEHLADAMKKINEAEDDPEKFKIARDAVKKGVAIKERIEKARQTSKDTAIKKDKDEENEFYVGASGMHGAFGFEREPAPKVKLKDVYGKSFDEMKTHLEDLADYSKYLHLYGATAPRGKIKSNMIAIGPYGCGKTEIGRAIAGDKRFIGADVAVTDLLTCWFGEFEKNVDRVWDAAKELRRNSGDNKLVFLLMDEFDSWFGNTNGHWVDRTYQRVQKAIQMKLDGVVDYEGIITVGFTNEPANVPLAIYRRFKYVDIVGELEKQERIDLLKHFLRAGLPMSSGFKNKHYQKWGSMMDGATGDVIGKVADDIHYEFMRQFIEEHPKDGRRLNNYIRKMHVDGKNLDKKYIKREIGKHLKVTPVWVEEKINQKINDPIIVEQIETAVRVYAEARKVLANLHKRQDAATGSLQGPQYRTRNNVI